MSTSTNSEVSKKLRAAIKAKLEELGVYVDDELPDYIMVMIANKKEKKQMKEDLNLFLSKNTDAFVEWLFEIFERLQSAPKGPNPVAPSSSTVSDESPKEKKKEATKRKAVPASTPPKAKKSEARPVEKKKIEAPPRELDKEREQKERERERESLRKEREKKDAERREIATREREREREERERRERDRERERERREREEKERREKEEREKREEKERRRDSPPPTHNRRIAKIESRGRRALSPEEKRRRDVKVEEDEVVKDVKKVSSQVVSRPSPPPPTIQSKIVVQRKLKKQPDARGAKGTANMFMKAMNAASASAGYGVPSIAPETRKRSAEAHKVKAEIQKIEFSDEEQFANGDDENEEEEEEVPIKRTRGGVTATVKKEVVSPVKKAPLKRKIIQPATEKTEKTSPRFIITLGGKEGDKKRSVQRGGKDKDEEKDNTIRVSSTPKKKKKEEKRSKAEEDEDEMALAVSPPQKHSSPSDWDGHIRLNDEDETSDDEAAIDAVLAQTRASRLASLHEEERIPPTHTLSRGNSYYDMYDPRAAMAQQQQYVPTYVPTPLAQQNVSSPGYSSSSTSIVSNAAPSLPPNRLQEKCRFWPNCKLDTCIYLHPKTPCMKFPKCPFGQRCLYVHPKCKFDPACANPSCVYTHYAQKGTAPTAFSVAAVAAASSVTPATVKADNENGAVVVAPVAIPAKIEPDVPLVAAPLSSVINCRFGGRCINPKCTYKHPQTCRFGKNCLNPACYFYHPPASRPATVPAAAIVPKPAIPAAGASKFKWSATPAIVKS